MIIQVQQAVVKTTVNAHVNNMSRESVVTGAKPAITDCPQTVLLDVWLVLVTVKAQLEIAVSVISRQVFALVRPW